MLRTAQRAVEDVDVVCLVVDATARSAPDDLVLAPLREYHGMTVCALNKIDLVRPKTALLPRLDRWRGAHPFGALVPIAAVDGTNCDRLLDVLVAALPEHPPFFPPDATSDQPETFWVAEIVREQIFHFTHQDVPYAAAVRVEELTERRDARTAGHPGHDLRRAGLAEGHPHRQGRHHAQAYRHRGPAAAGGVLRHQGVPQLHVQVRRNWRKDARALREFGFSADVLTWRSAARPPWSSAASRSGRATAW